MLRIFHERSAGIGTIRLEGKLLAPWVDAVRSEIDAHFTEGPIRLELSGLSFADAAGVDLLESVRRNGIELVGASSFIANLLARP